MFFCSPKTSSQCYLLLYNLYHPYIAAFVLSQSLLVQTIHLVFFAQYIFGVQSIAKLESAVIYRSGLNFFYSKIAKWRIQ